MKVLIVTVYNSENCGSFMQAYALSTVLRSMGNQVFLYNRKQKNSPPSYFILFKQIVSMIMEGKKSQIPIRVASFFNFRADRKYFDSMITKQKECFDAVVIGSDTLWNFEVSSFYERRNVYMGEIFEGLSRYTYAVSLSNTSLNYVTATDFFVKGLKNFSKISVRDEHTYEVVTSLCSKEVSRVCDPTLLLNPTDYKCIMGKAKPEKFIFLYIFSDERISDSFGKQVVTFSRKNGLAIISFGEARNWADKNIPYSPQVFLDYISRADYVLTNTFHGSVFSAIFHRQVAILGKNKNKVIEIANLLKLDSQLLSQDDNLEECLNKYIDYNVVEGIIKEERRKGREFLHTCMDEAEKTR